MLVCALIQCTLTICVVERVHNSCRIATERVLQGAGKCNQYARAPASARAHDSIVCPVRSREMVDRRPGCLGAGKENAQEKRTQGIHFDASPGHGMEMWRRTRSG